jgi:hypothetical protein
MGVEGKGSSSRLHSSRELWVASPKDMGAVGLLLCMGLRRKHRTFHRSSICSGQDTQPWLLLCPLCPLLYSICCHGSSVQLPQNLLFSQQIKLP